MAEELSGITAADIMIRQVITIHNTATIPEFLELLQSNGITGMPVVDESGKVCGVVSVSDVARFMANVHEKDRDRLKPDVDFYNFSLEHAIELNTMEGFYMDQDRKILVQEIMTPAPVTVKPETTVREVARIMHEKKIHRIIVSSTDGEITGIISTLDILNAVARSVCS